MAISNLISSGCYETADTGNEQHMSAQNSTCNNDIIMV